MADILDDRIDFDLEDFSGDSNRVETRGRKPKEKPEGIVKVPIELDPTALAIIGRVQEIGRIVGTGVPTRSEVIRDALSVHVERVEREMRAAGEYMAGVWPIAMVRAARSLPEPAWVPLTLDADTHAAITILYDHFTSVRDQSELICRTLKEAAEWVRPNGWIAVPMNSETLAALNSLADAYKKAKVKPKLKTPGEVVSRVLIDAATSIVTAEHAPS